MIAFDVRIDGVHRCLAGIGEFGVLSLVVEHTPLTPAHLDRLPRDAPAEARWPLKVHLGGLPMDSELHAGWLDEALRAGSELVVRVVETEHADPPARRWEHEGCALPPRDDDDDVEHDDDDDFDPFADPASAPTARVCLDVEVNGARRYRAGLRGRGLTFVVLDAVVRSPENLARLLARDGPGTFVEQAVTLSGSGMVWHDDRAASWGREALAVGDEVTVRLVEADDPDEPTMRPVG